MDKFSGRCTGICQRAAKYAIRESIEKDIERRRHGLLAEATRMQMTTTMCQGKKSHFEMAMSEADAPF